MYGLKGRLYLVYNIFISADFIQIDDMPPIIPVARDIEDVDSNVVIHLKNITNLKMSILRKNFSKTLQ